MKSWKLLIPVPFVVLLLAMVPQDPAAAAKQSPQTKSKIMRVSAVQYVDTAGKQHQISSRNVVEVRMLEGFPNGIRFEVLYENGDYSMIDAQALHILRSGNDKMNVRLVSCPSSDQRFPMLP
ncbi:MAG: hypothetical protein VYE77_09555 [Planctomycetota bacterium]|nr:hypothetical protein [Planctomycetota bacterium]